MVAPLEVRPEPLEMQPDPGPLWIDNTSPELAHAWYPVALSTELVEGPLRVELLGQDWALVRLDRRGAGLPRPSARTGSIPLSAGAVCDGVLRCGYHGWEFAGDGRCTRLPSQDPGTAISGRSRLRPAAAVEERFGVIWLAPEEPVTPLPSFPEWSDPTFEGRIDTPCEIAAGTGQIMDNSCDTSHFLMVHAGTFGGEQTATSFPRSVERGDWTITAEYEVEYRVIDDPLGPVDGQLFPSRQTKRFHLGAMLELRMEFPHDGSTFSILVAVQPQNLGTSRIYRWFARDDMGHDEERWQECLRVEAEIMQEDVRALERFRHHRLPLDLRHEVHVPADRLSLAYRRLLLDLVEHARTSAGPPIADPSVADPSAPRCRPLHRCARPDPYDRSPSCLIRSPAAASSAGPRTSVSA